MGKKNLKSISLPLVGAMAICILLNYMAVGALSDTKDTKAPVISGAKDITVEVGGTVSYRKGVTVTDDQDPNPKLGIDSSKVNLNKVGVYKVVYAAVDAAGNSSAVTVKVNVVDKVPKWTEESMTLVAAQIILDTCTPDMSDYDKAWALYRYMKNNCTYTHTSGDMSSIYAGAYEGLCLKKTDCFGYAASYQLLLDTAGIENMMVSRVGGTSNHYWNLVKMDTGWYHTDSSPRSLSMPYQCFMQTDAQIAAYTKKFTKVHPEKPNYFTFDGSKYPERGTVILYGK